MSNKSRLPTLRCCFRVSGIQSQSRAGEAAGVLRFRRSTAISRILSPARSDCSESGEPTTIPLAPSSLAGSCDLPGGFGRAALKRLPIWSCSVRGLACHSPYGERGALLPHHFTLTYLHKATQNGRPRDNAKHALRLAVCFLCHFPSGHPDRELPGALSFGVRTFLSACSSKQTHAAAV